MTLIFEPQNDAPTSQQFLSAQPDGTFTVPNAGHLFNGTFSRAGQDLLIANDGADTLRIADYFTNSDPADIYAPDGAVLRGAAVERLAGPIAPGQYAQTGTATALGPIGQVEVASGDASVQRVDGIVEPLSVGMKIYQDDVLQTADGSSLSVTFVDGTIFTLASGSRMIIDELIYDPASSSNTGTFNLIQGGFVFIAGQVAKTGGMDVNTPSATMGIRGTTVIVEIQAVDGVVVSEVSLTRDPDGDVGEIVLRNTSGEVVANIVDTTSKWILTSANGDVRQVERSLTDDAEDNLLIAEAVAAYRSAFARVDAGDTFVTLGDSGSGNSSASPTEEGQENFQVDSIDEPTGIETEEPEELQPSEDPSNGSRDEGNLLLEEFEVRDISVAVLEDPDGAISGGILGDGAVGQGLVFQLTSAPANGTATVTPDGQFAFVPNLNFNGQDSFNYAVTQLDGTVVIGTVRVNVLPVNDNPDVTDVQTSAQEDGSITGILTAADVDGDPLTYSLETGATNGGVVLLPNGTYNYTPDPDFAGVDNFRVLVSDGQGGTGIATVTVTVTGTNDAPRVTSNTAAAQGGVTEDGTAAATGQLTAIDVDAGDTPQWSGSTAGALGSFAITAGGAWTYTLNNAAAQSLAQGQTQTEVFTATVADATGATAQQEVRVTVTGTNDAPRVTSNTTAQGGVTEDGTATATGQLTATDADAGAAPQWSGSSTGTYGSFAITAGGAWTYTLNNASAQSLTQGQTKTEVFTATATDASGATAQQEVRVTVTGTNDGPRVSSNTATQGNVTEDGTATATGQLTATDVDAGDAPQWSGSSTGTYGSFAITAGGAWTYTLNNASAQSLAQGQTKTEIFTATATDATGATAEQEVRVTVTGTNDVPRVTSSAAAAQGGVTEDGTATATGQLTATDADAGAAPQWSGSSTGTYGSFAITAGGAWTYTLNNASAQSLAQGQTKTEIFTATATDATGATAEQEVRVTVTGTNDVPRVTSSAAAAQGGVTEDGTATATGQLTATDADAGAAPQWSGSSTGTYGSFAITAGGAWTYTLNNASAQSLAQGQTKTEIFTATATDATGATAEQEVRVTVTGTNDVPRVTSSAAAAQGGVTEDGTATATGQLTATDADAGAAPQWSGSSTGTYGSFAITAGGAWTYTLNNASAQSLAQGQTKTEIFTATATDATGATAEQEVRVTVTGTNDVPRVTSSAAAAQGGVTEDGTATATGQLTATDADAGAAPQWSGSSTGTYGSFAITAGGAWTYTLNNASAQSLAQGQTKTEIFTATATDATGATAEQEVRVTVTGTNDVPRVTSSAAAAQGGVTEDGTATATGQLTATDADAGAAPQWSGSSTGTYGSFAITAGGAWTYTLNNASAQSLAQGQTKTEIFTATATDATGATAEQEVRVTVTGTNDGPVINLANSALVGSVTEGAETTFAEGRLVATDPDANGTVNWTGGGNGLYGTFAILADGSWTYLLDNVRAEVLSAGGDPVTETFTATATDNLGASLTQNVTITIIGTNDAPVISKTIVAEVTQNTAFSGAIVATDADSVGNLVFAAVAGSGPANGSLTLNDDGTYVYTPNTNFQGLDSFGFTVRDADGGVTSGSVTVEVESPPVTTPGGAVTSVGISTTATTTTAAGNLAIKASPPDATSVNLVFALDGSGSIGSTGWQQQTESVAVALEQLRSQFSGSATSVDVKIVTFATGVRVSQTYNLLDPDVDLAADVRALSFPGGFTRWDLAFDEAEKFFDSQPASETNFLLFITDGRPTGGAWVDALDSLRNGGSTNYGVTIEAYGIGTAIDFNTLSQVDATPTLLNSPSELSGALSGSAIFNPILIDFELTLISDGVDQGVIATKASSGVVSSGLNYDLALAEIDGIETMLGTENRFSATVRFDLDGKTDTAEIVLFTTERLNASTVAEVLTGFEKSDLLLGGDLDDVINGAGGNDVILGYGGHDTIDGGTGSDIIIAGGGDDVLVLSNAPGADIDRLIGGAGTDTLRIDIGNAPGTDLLPSLELSGIEAIDMANGLANSLKLTLADILDMSDTGHAELNSLLGADLTESIVILGDGFNLDRLTLEAEGTGEFRAASTASVVDGAGNSLNIYEYVDGGNVLATLGIEDGVNVDIPVA